MRTTTRIGRCGNSAGPRLTKAMLREAKIAEGDTVEVSVSEGEIVLRTAPHTYSLSELVSRITPQNQHGETDW